MHDTVGLILVSIGVRDWGSIGSFQFDIVAWLFGGQSALSSRSVYSLVGLASVWLISLLFRDRENHDHDHDSYDSPEHYTHIPHT